MMKKSIVLVLCLIIGLVLSACDDKQIAAEDISGTWVDDCGSSSETDSCSTFLFLADGTFEAENISQRYFKAKHPENARVDRTGTWSLSELSYDEIDKYVVHLTFDPDLKLENGFGYQSVFFVTLKRSHLILSAWADDESQKIIFTKENEH